MRPVAKTGTAAHGPTRLLLRLDFHGARPGVTFDLGQAGTMRDRLAPVLARSRRHVVADTQEHRSGRPDVAVPSASAPISNSGPVRSSIALTLELVGIGKLQLDHVAVPHFVFVAVRFTRISASVENVGAEAMGAMLLGRCRSR